MVLDKLKFLLAITIAGVLIIGCATTCERMTVRYEDHPEKPHPAKSVIFECGEKIVKWNVSNPPPAACMAKCFAPAEKPSSDGE